MRKRKRAAALSGPQLVSLLQLLDGQKGPTAPPLTRSPLHARENQRAETCADAAEVPTAPRERLERLWQMLAVTQPHAREGQRLPSSRFLRRRLTPRRSGPAAPSPRFGSHSSADSLHGDRPGSDPRHPRAPAISPLPRVPPRARIALASRFTKCPLRHQSPTRRFPLHRRIDCSLRKNEIRQERACP